MNKSLIWQHDAWKQHFRALAYYAKYLRQIILKLIFNHRLDIPGWDFCIGEGSDIINTLHYYVIGDPIALFSVFVPTRYMHLFYSFSCILRLYLAGIAFSALAFGTGLKNRYGIIAGALSYSFCFWALYSVGKNPYFLNPMIYFPLILLGVEKIIRKEKPYILILSVAVSAASNFYFFYMLVILTGIYVLVRLSFLHRKDFKKIISALFKITVMSAVGVCMAGVIFLPVLIMFLQDSRISVSQPFHWLYPSQYYSQLPSIVITSSASYWLCMGFSAPVVITLFILIIRRKENRFLKVLLGICITIILFPIGGRILNGMSYMTNRWSWAFALLCSYILVKEWNVLISIQQSEWIKTLVCTVAFYVVCLLCEQSRSSETFAAVPLLFISLFIIKQKSLRMKNIWCQQVLLIFVVGINAISLGFWHFAPGGGNYASEFIENNKIEEELANNETEIIKGISDMPYLRYTGRAITPNANMSNQISSTQYYWSNSNPYINMFRSDLEMKEQSFYDYNGYDDRTTAIALSSVQYYVTNEGNDKGMPYGYTRRIDYFNAKYPLQQTYLDALKQELGTDELTDEQSGKLANSLINAYSVYQNEYTLPLGYCYSSYIGQETWEDLDAVQKQELQLEAAYVDGLCPDGIAEYTGEVSDYSLPFEIDCGEDDIVETETGFLTTSSNETAVLLFEGTGNAETYLCLEGFDFKAVPEYDLYFGDETADPRNLYNKANWAIMSRDQQIEIRKRKVFWNYVNKISLTLTSSAGIVKTLNYLPPDAEFSSGRHDFIVNLGYLEEPVTSITITFPSQGIYTIENLRVYSVPMDQYAEKISALQENTLQNIMLNTDIISGEINIDSPQLLCLAVPYSTGWKAFVDGKETPVMLTNERYLGILVPAGFHTIEFHYSMPYKHAGIVLSLVGIVVLIIIIVLTEKRHQAKKTPINS